MADERGRTSIGAAVIRQASPPEAHELLQAGYRYIDVRTEKEFAAGHPVGAVNIPVVFPDPATGQMALNPEFLDVMRAHFAPDAPLVVGCQGGVRSQRAADLLVQAGYSRIVNMQGGFGGARDQQGRTVVPGWGECGLPICRDCGPDTSYAVLRTGR
jgi:rhodanese-related sulfurtransferase